MWYPKAYLHFDGFIENKRKKKKSCVYSFRLVPENTDRPPTQIYGEADKVQASGSPFVLAGSSRKQAHLCGCFYFFFFF